MTALVLFACVVGAAVLVAMGAVVAAVLLSGWRGRG